MEREDAKVKLTSYKAQEAEQKISTSAKEISPSNDKPSGKSLSPDSTENATSDKTSSNAPFAAEKHSKPHKMPDSGQHNPSSSDSVELRKKSRDIENPETPPEGEAHKPKPTMKKKGSRRWSDIAKNIVKSPEDRESVLSFSFSREDGPESLGIKFSDADEALLEDIDQVRRILVELQIISFRLRL